MAGIDGVRRLAEAGIARTLTQGARLDAPSVGDSGRGGPLAGAATIAPGGGTPFAQQLAGLLEDVNAMQHQASTLAEGLAKGSVTDLHQVMLAQEEASVAFKLVAEVRNRLVAAYQEVMRMPV